METTHHRFIFITGGSRGIGRAIALSQAKPGTFLFINYLRDDEAASQIEKEIEERGAKACLLQGSVGDPETIQTLFKEIQRKTERLDALIHNAALGVFKPVSQLRVKDWDISMDVNAKALLLLAQTALPLMKQTGGKIIAISSLGSRRYTPNYGAIGVSKAALENLIRYLAVELAPHKIGVNGVCGGLIETDSLKMFPDIERMKSECLKRTPGGRVGKPEDLANVVAFLLSPESNWIFGQTIVADGGYSLF
ncbi:MAG: SDR family oxidoreductase [Candidatus Omnitrophica bacterium]|nr:SDR family oxidoreductase [Candidatus Omnitrophota bacterium]